MVRKRTRWLIGGGILAAVLVGGAFLAVQFFGGNAPAKVSLTLPTASASGSASTGAANGTWQVDTSLGSFSDFTSTWAGYRVQEQLANVGANTAVGRTPNVSGSLTIDGMSITDVSVSVDMTTLQSDRSQRDNSLRERGLQTNQFTTATFTLTSPIDLGHKPATGKQLDATASGDFTLHGVTNQVRIPVKAVWTGSEIEVVSSFDVALADYRIDPPTGFIVLSIADQGTVELHLLFSRA